MVLPDKDKKLPWIEVRVKEWGLKNIVALGDRGEQSSPSPAFYDVLANWIVTTHNEGGFPLDVHCLTGLSHHLTCIVILSSYTYIKLT